MTDRDFAVWIRNIGLAIRREAKARGISIDIYANDSGYACARFGEYNHCIFDDEEEKYRYEPTGGVDRWRQVRPEEIRIDGEPLLPEKSKEIEGKRYA